MTTLEIFGDWRDLRGAVERADPKWQTRSDEERAELWNWADRVIAEYSPMKVQCWGRGCERIISARSAYRCADCGGHYCNHCIRPHFKKDGRAPE